MTLPFPYGLSLAPIPPPVPPDRREFLDQNGQIQNARYINPQTKDFELSANGHFVGEPAIDQQVYLALITTFGSSAQANLGQSLMASIPLITPNLTQQVTTVINIALANLVNAGLILINKITVSVSPIPGLQQVSILVLFTNTQTGQSNTVTIPINSPTLP